MTRNAKYDEAVLAAKQINEEILAVNRMMMTETIPFYRIEFVKELKKLSKDYLKQNKIIEETKSVTISTCENEVLEKKREKIIPVDPCLDKLFKDNPYNIRIKKGLRATEYRLYTSGENIESIIRKK